MSKFGISSVILFCALFSSLVRADFSQLVTFGDSLSDTGNLSAVTLDFPFPFYQNRISDGPLLVDYLAQQFGGSAAPSLHLDDQLAGFNYAVAGGNIVGEDEEDLASQVTAYLSRTNDRAAADALFFVLIGGNDLRDLRSIVSPALAESQIDLIVQTLTMQLSRLISAGARTLAVPNAADIGRLPETLARLESDPDVAMRSRQYTQTYNRKLRTALQELATTRGVIIAYLDLFNEFDVLLNQASLLGFSQTEVGCFSLSGFDFHADCVFGARFDRFVFFDSLHPSSRTNKLVAPGLIAELTEILNRPAKIIIAPALSLLLTD